ncbi:D-2-hydroxyacid dehydrogenase [Salinibacterium sp. SWN1162]|uniref:D-2-hydroxyacid dehydrogenase n=1 Tax=Salinibacterium sp. SWN1162 TaxID=2792053 RepID=UPI0018CD737A|nr:D-2-hydroxyacid dehydrogenase [Salinibacterium sp. SWN1162]MBH0008691.1 D-2-hydroxyacid dehydrogenase [Salinibacterium sp. SWN1162]
MKVLIASYLEPKHIAAIRNAHPEIEVMYEPELLPIPEYVSDHDGPRPDLSAADQARWDAMLASADVSFDFDWQDPTSLPTRAPNLRWIQATSAGIGGFMQRTGLDQSNLVATTAGGVHAVPLAEFALTGVLYFVKDLPRLRAQQRAHRWERYTASQLAGRRVTVVGIGGMGANVVRIFDSVGAKVTAVGRVGGSYELPDKVRVTDISQLDSELPTTDVLIMCTALTPETEGLISAARVDALPEHAIFVNISRGQTVDEDALIAALREGRLAGAALDVVREEPLPETSALWDLDNVIISPHSAATVETENETLTALFIENLGRFQRGQPMINVFNADRGY